MRTRNSEQQSGSGQALVEVGLVAGIIAILLIASFALVIQWSSQKFVNESTSYDKSDEFITEFEKLK